MSRPSRDDLPRHVAAMLDPGFYERTTAEVTLVQTHISFVLLTDDTVYKLKKPVRFSFLDFSTLERRRHFCREELRLNRRLAGDVYEGVAALVPNGDGFMLAAEDHPNAVEYVVVMRRLPADRMLATLLTRDAVTTDLIEAIVRRLVDFHVKADSGPEVRLEGTPSRLLQAMNADFEETERFRGNTITPHDDDAIAAFCREQVDRLSPLLVRRRDAGRVRDCHGDLHAEHICFTDGLVIFDCIEFNAAFRYRDVAAEVAFLAMDLDYRGHPELASLFVRRYSEVSGDAEVPLVTPLFQAHRAYIRGKVDSLKSAEPEVGEVEQRAAADSARRHFDLAYRYTWRRTCCLLVIVGLSGSGKSTLARELHRRTGFAHFNSDVIRKRLAGIPSTSRVGARDDAGLYGAEHSARTYQEMLAAAAGEVKAGRGAIVDATFLRRHDRDAARAVASAVDTPVLFVECEVSLDEAVRRLRLRVDAGGDPSDADEGIYRRQRTAYEPFAADEAPLRFVADMSGALPEVVERVEDRLRVIGAPR